MQQRLAKAVAQQQLPPQRQQPPSRRMQLKGHKDFSNKPMSTSKQLNFLQSWGQRRNTNSDLTEPSQGVAEQSMKQPPGAMPTAKTPTAKAIAAGTAVASSTSAKLIARRDTLLNKEELVRGCFKMSGELKNAKRLTFIPVSAWVNNTGEDYDSEKGKHEEQTGCDQQSGNLTAPEGAVSASTVERLFSLDEQSMSSNSFIGVKRTSSSTPTPNVTVSSTKTEASPSSLPATTTPAPLPPPSPPPRTVSNGNRRVLRQPSDVAALLHEVLRGSSGLGVEASKNGAQPGISATSTASNPVKGLAVGKAKRAKKSTDSARGASSPDASMLEALARVIVERINCTDQRDKRRNKRGKGSLLDQMKVNRALLETGEDIKKCSGSSNSTDKKKGSIHYKLLKGNVTQQKNCNNCFQKKPIKKCRFLSHHNHFPSISCNHTDRHTAAISCSNKSGQSLNPNDHCHHNGLELLSDKLRAAEQQFKLDLQRSIYGSPCGTTQPFAESLQMLQVPSNGSNANYQSSCELFFERVDAQTTEHSLCRHDETPPSSSSTEIRERRSSNRSLICKYSTDDGADTLTNNHCFGRANTASSPLSASNRPVTCSSMTVVGALSEVSLSKAQSECHPDFHWSEIHGSTEGPSLLSCYSKQFETMAGSTKTKEGVNAVRKRQLPRMKRSRKRTSADTSSAAAAEAYRHDLFKSLLRSRDESSFVQPMADEPCELSLKAVCADFCSAVGETNKFLSRKSPVKIFVPESMKFHSKRDASTGDLQSEQGSFSTQRVTISELKQGDFALHKLHQAPPAASLPWTECAIDESAQTVNSKSRQTRVCNGASHIVPQAIRRRSTVHVVEPLADAVQQLIEMPVGIIEQHFRSWRPTKFSGLVTEILLIFSTEVTIEAVNQPVSLFSHNCGSMVTVDSKVTRTIPTGSFCYSTESIFICFARRVATKVIESLGMMKRLFQGTQVNGVELLNRTIMVTDRQKLCKPKLKSGPNAIRELQTPSTCSMPGQDLELLCVTTNLAVRFRLTNRQSDNDSRSCHFGRQSSRPSGGLNCAFSATDGTSEIAPTHSDDIRWPQPLRLDSIVCGCDDTGQFNPAAVHFINWRANGCTRSIVTHCPELVTNQNLTAVSLPGSTDDYISNEAPSVTTDTATSDNQSNDSRITTNVLGNLSHQRTTQKEILVHVTDEMLLYSDEAQPLVEDGNFLDPQNTGKVSMMEQNKQLHRQKLLTQNRQEQASGFGTFSGDWNEWQPAEKSTVYCHGASSRGSPRSDLALCRSNNSHGFFSHSAASLISETDKDDVYLSITCELTVADSVRDPCTSSCDESLCSNSSELVCA